MFPMFPVFPMPRPALPVAASSHRERGALGSRVAVLLALALALSGCGHQNGLQLGPNQAPTLTLNSGPIDTTSVPLSWVVDLSWTASDPDGSVDHFEYAIDPPGSKAVRMALADTVWVSTSEHAITVHFRASNPDTTGPGATASEHHTFVLRAVDERGARSLPVVRSFYAYTIAPNVQFIEPAALLNGGYRVGVPFRLSWLGSDPDGSGTNQPASYRIRLIRLDIGDNATFLADPELLWREGVYTNWEAWRTVGGDTTSLDISGPEFAPGQRWLAAIIAIDQAGAATAYLSTASNLLVFVTDADAGPSIHLASEWITFSATSDGGPAVGGFTAPASESFAFRWEQTATPGRRPGETRWVLDPADPFDETPRSNENTDLTHWSAWLPGSGTAAFGPLGPGVHRLLVQARDDQNSKRQLEVDITSFSASLDRELLVIDDTRFELDRAAATGCVSPYTRVWPSAAELDTFMYARGGVPWRCTTVPGSISAPGLLAGYSFDTLGTRARTEFPAQTVTLPMLAQYRRVLWLVDQRSAILSTASDPTVFPVTALRAMSNAARQNALTSYIKMGGQVWLAGGGAATATLMDRNARGNDTPGSTVFSGGELTPFDVMSEDAHVRSALAASQSRIDPVRSARAVGGWSGHGPGGTLSAPDYSLLPAVLHMRSRVTDALPPTRGASQASLYYDGAMGVEHVSAPNVIVEDLDPDPLVTRLESTLDTLYEVPDPNLITPLAPAMLYYHGRDNAPLVFTGLELWRWTRDDAQGLVDFVLHDIWGMTKSGPQAAASRAASGGVGNRRRAPRVSSWRRLDPLRMRP